MAHPITNAPLWTAKDLEESTSWLHLLSPEEISDFERGLRVARETGKSMFELAKADFPFGDEAQRVFDFVVRGTQRELGLVQLRGFPVNRYGIDDMRLLYWGIGLHLGVPRPQGKQSQFMSDVTDAGGTYRSGTGRGYNTSSALDFHADAGDVVGLLCLQAAKSGGSSLISSSVAAHNEMLRERPDLVEVLYRPFTFSRQGEQAPEEPPYFQMPVFGMEQGRFACRHVRNHIRGAQLTFPEVARLTREQEDALDLFDKTLARDDLCFHTYLQPGDMQFLNNHVVLHSRTQYEDHPEPERKRHLLRLWLSLPDAQPLPHSWSPYFKDVSSKAVRGGFRGLNINEEIEAFERRVAHEHGMAMRVYADREAFRASAAVTAS